MGDFSENEQHILKNCPLLNHLSDENYQAFIEISSRSTFGKGHILLKEGELNDDFFIIVSGTVGLYKKENKTSTPELIGTLTTGETIDEMRVIQNRTCALTVIAIETTVVLQTSISKLHALEKHQCHGAIVASVIKIISDRLLHSNETILNKIHEKKRKNKQILYVLFGALVLFIFLCEVGLGLYYTLNPTNFCNDLNSIPAENTKVAL
ncbi:cyclic nucleotide-binding domain-containing protein [Legionella qingyii]|uniref:Cyclic nucleotide-binding domain-containing protein n=1 Tax=Legionella qingyii TaxID=2184757 RepID=A0A317U3N7_9GAMM|nr:cyclic nucleotide-binding domain-containing protein [Legionella qingyii]PWY56634.1 cyclic nucleotide-binding domain-containing protein [Legionella qingyii]RUR23447.1 cyclic nucleotide-binding domain-containing protein [Legionella qingyii]RUR26106.1 cyclic nucleotide-binding domain-containing protein [Legionella qingyii]